MADETDRDREGLRLATHDEVRDSLEYALCYKGRRRINDPGAESFMTRIAAERLCEHLRLCGFVILRKPPAAAPDFSKLSPPRLPLKD